MKIILKIGDFVEMQNGVMGKIVNIDYPRNKIGFHLFKGEVWYYHIDGVKKVNRVELGNDYVSLD